MLIKFTKIFFAVTGNTHALQLEPPQPSHKMQPKNALARRTNLGISFTVKAYEKLKNNGKFDYHVYEIVFPSLTGESIVRARHSKLTSVLDRFWLLLFFFLRDNPNRELSENLSAVTKSCKEFCQQTFSWNKNKAVQKRKLALQTLFNSMIDRPAQAQQLIYIMTHDGLVQHKWAEMKVISE